MCKCFLIVFRTCGLGWAFSQLLLTLRAMLHMITAFRAYVSPSLLRKRLTFLTSYATIRKKKNLPGFKSLSPSVHTLQRTRLNLCSSHLRLCVILVMWIIVALHGCVSLVLFTGKQRILMWNACSVSSFFCQFVLAAVIVKNTAQSLLRPCFVYGRFSSHPDMFLEFNYILWLH